MYNWLSIRKPPRTEGPNYPALAAQTVDATVAKWIPIATALLACATTPARAKLDVRTYDWAPSQAWIEKVTEPPVKTWAPVFNAQLQSYCTTARPPLDVRRYEWSPEAFDIVTRVDQQVRTWQPASRTELDSTRTPGRPLLDVRGYDWAPSAFDIVTRVDLQVRAWQPAARAELDGACTRGRPLLDVRQYDWAPEASGIVGPVNAAVQAWTPAFGAELASFRTARAGPLDVRTYDWFIDPSHWFAEPVAIIASVTAPKGERTPGRPALDVRSYEWSGGWVQQQQQQQQFPPSTAQELPAFQDRSVRTSAPSAYDRTGPQPVFTASLPAFVPWSDEGARTAAARPLDVRRYDWVADASAWKPQTIDALIAQWAPFFSGGDRTGAARALDVRVYSWDAGWTPQPPPAAKPGGSGPSAATGTQGWFLRRVYERTTGPQPVFTASLPGTTPPTVAQTLPAFQQDGGARTADRARLDVRAYECYADPSKWTGDPVTARNAAVWAPKGERTAARATFGTGQLADVASWYVASQNQPSVTVAQTAPAWTSQAQSFRTASDQTLDLFRTQSIPDIFGVPDDWITWVPFQSVGGRVDDRARVDVRRFDSTPSWPIAPPAATPPTVAQTWPAFAAELASFRTAAQSQIPIATAPTWPAQPFVAVPPTVAQTWPAIGAELASFRTPAAAVLDVRAYEWGQAVRTSAVTDAIVALQASAFTWAKGERTGAQLQVSVATGPTWPTQPAAAVPPSVAQTWPAMDAALRSFRTDPRPALDVRAYEWSQRALTPAVLDARVAQQSPAWTWNKGQATPASGFRAVTTENTWPAAPSVTTPAQQLAACSQALASFRTASAPSLDVRRHDWIEPAGWLSTEFGRGSVFIYLEGNIVRTLRLGGTITMDVDAGGTIRPRIAKDEEI